MHSLQYAFQLTGKYIHSSFPLDRLWLRVGTKQNFKRENPDTRSYEEHRRFYIDQMIWFGRISENESIEQYSYDLLEDYTEIDGTLFVCESGCGLDYHLVLNGKHRGEVWQVCGDAGVAPVSDDFLSFIQNWLNESFTDVTPRTIEYHINHNEWDLAQNAFNQIKEKVSEETRIGLIKKLENRKQKFKTRKRTRQDLIIQSKHLIQNCLQRFNKCVDLTVYTYKEFIQERQSLLDSRIFEWEFDFIETQVGCIDPPDPFLLNALLRFFYETGRSEKFKSLRRVLPKSIEFETENNLDKKDYVKAIHDLREDLELVPNCRSSRFRLATLLSQSDEYDNAENIFKQLISEDEDFNDAYIGIAENYLRQKKLKKLLNG